MDITKIKDLELAKLLTEQTEALFQTQRNVELLKAELKRRQELESLVDQAKVE